MTRQHGLSRRARRVTTPLHLLDIAIVLETYLPDHPRNMTGVDVECDVILVQTRQLHTNVPVMQRGSGVYSQWPRWKPVPSRTDLGDADGEIRLAYRLNETKTSRLDDLDGEQVILGYIRSNNTDPVIMGTLGHSQTKLIPRRRDGRLHHLVHQGASLGVDDDGGVFVDITQSKGQTRAPISIRMAADQVLSVQQGRRSIAFRTDSDGNMRMTQSSGVEILFSPSGDVNILAPGTVSCRSGFKSQVTITNGSATVASNSVTLRETETESSENPGELVIGAGGIQVSKGGEELLQVILEAFEALAEAVSPTAGGPLLRGVGGDGFATIFAQLQSRLQTLGVFE